MTKKFPSVKDQIDTGRHAIKSRPWFLRPPTDRERQDGMSASRLVTNQISSNQRLQELGGDIEAEAKKRGTAAYIAYLLPLLIEDEAGRPVFDIQDAESMATLEGLPGDVTGELITVFWAMFEKKLNGVKG